MEDKTGVKDGGAEPDIAHLETVVPAEAAAPAPAAPLTPAASGAAVTPTPAQRLLMPSQPTAETSPADPLPRGMMLGRFIVLDRVGAGGMGVVYKAYDPELDRRVAIKVVRADRGSAGRERLLREAQAMAKLSHPNVIPVFEVDTFGDDVFLAMEYVEGQTLRAWLAAKPRSIAEIVDVFAQAGCGLGAAHAAGLIHRDFKPENAMIGPDGRVRVLDFGLVRAVADGSDDPTDPLGGPARQADAARPLAATAATAGAARSHLTQTGAAIGTPAYMAPEQHAGKISDPRTDQFAFAVALYEALYGVRPFAGETRAERAASALAGNVTVAPRGSRVPARLRTALLRALSARPEDRFASMQELLRALLDNPHARQRRRSLAAGAIALACTVGGVTVYLWGNQLSAPCRGAEARWEGIWDAERKASLHAAFAKIGRPYAEDVWKAVERTLDGYTNDWSAMRTDACEATSVRGEQSAEVLDRRMMCLDDALEEVKALTREYARMDVDLLDGAYGAARGLTAVDGCADVEALLSPVPPPRDPGTRQKVDEARKLLAEARAVRLAGRYAEAQKLVDKLVADARALAYAPLEAEVQYLRGVLAGDRGQSAASREALLAAVADAEDGHHDEARLKAATALVFINSPEPQQLRDAATWATLANALLRRMGSPPSLEAELRASEAHVRVLEGKYTEAQALNERALALNKQVYGPEDLEVARTRGNLAMDLVEQGKYEAAIEQCDLAIAIYERRLGPKHPSIAQLLNNTGSALYYLGRADEALDRFARARAILEAALGPDDPALLNMTINMASVYDTKDDIDNALATFKRALALAEKSSGPESPQVGAVLANMAGTYQKRGEYDLAAATAKRAVQIREATVGKEHPDTGIAVLNLGSILTSMGRVDEGIVTIARAIDIGVKSVGEESLLVAEARNNMGEALRAAGRAQAAMTELRKSLAIREKLFGQNGIELAAALVEIGECHLDFHDAITAVAPLERALALTAANEPSVRAQAQFALGRALWETGDRQRAVGLVEQAHTHFQKTKVPFGAATTAARWLAEHKL